MRLVKTLIDTCKSDYKILVYFDIEVIYNCSFRNKSEGWAELEPFNLRCCVEKDADAIILSLFIL